MRLNVDARRADFHALHDAGHFLLPSAWDVGGARRLEALGFAGFASSNVSLAWALGRDDTLRERDEKEGRSGTPVLTELTVAVRRSRAFTDQLLKLARVEVGEASRSPARADLDELLSAVVAGHVTQASRKNIELSLHIKQAVTVPGTEIDLTNLLSNLVDNAIRYTTEQGSVAVSLRAFAGAAEIEISDTGIGIPPDALPRIYDRFYRAAGQEIEGSGLGLSIAKAVAEKYGFSLSIANRASGGVIARVGFPEVTIIAARADPEEVSA
jgi:signal transduction histidine kinase